MLRIALVTPILPIPLDLTRGRYIHETARSLARIADVRVFFQQLRYPKLPGVRPRSFVHGVVGDDHRLDGIDLESFSYPAVPVISRGLNGLMGARELLPRVRRFRPDIVLAYWVYPDGFAALRVARQLGVPCVIGALGSDIHVRSGLNTLLTRHVIEQADALLTVSETMRGHAIKRFGARPDDTVTIVNGFNTSIFRPLPQAESRQLLGVPADAEQIVYVGRFVEAKGLVELLDAFVRLAARRPRLQLAMVGDGVMRERLHQLVQEKGLGQRVVFPGGQTPEQVARWVSASNLLTLPSWSEGYPNVVVEAIACGRPVVATDVGGTHEIVHAGNGVLIPPRDDAALERALDDVLNRQWDATALAAGLTRSWDEVARETLNVCEAVVASTRPRRAA